MSKLFNIQPTSTLLKGVSSILCGLFIGTASLAANADSIDLSLSDSTARGEYQSYFKKNDHRSRQSRFRHMDDLNWGVNFLYHEDDGHVGGVSLHVAGKSKATIFKQRTGIGGKLITYDAGDPTGGALAVGGYILHNIASANLLSVRGDLYYAPSVVSFGDGERYMEYSVRLEYKVVEQASVYLGYRNIEVDFEKFGNIDIDNSSHLGLMMHF